MGKGDSSTTTQNYDPELTGAMKDIAELQYDIASQQWDTYVEYFQDYEITAAKTNADLLPYISDAAQKTLTAQAYDIEADKAVKDKQRVADLSQLDESIADIEANRPIKEQIRNEMMALSQEGQRDIEANRPLKDLSRTELMAYMNESLADIEANRPIKTAMRSQQMAEVGERLKEIGVSAGQIDRITSEIDRAAPIAEKFYKEAESGIDVGKRMNEAQAEVMNSVKLGEGMRRREASRMGINPNSSTFGKALSTDSMETAKAIAGARTGAKNQAEAENFGRLQTALGVRESNQGALRSIMNAGGATGQLVTSAPSSGTDRLGITNIPSASGISINPAQTTSAKSLPGVYSTGVGTQNISGQATSTLSGAANTYQPLASRVLSTTSKSSGGGPLDFLGTVGGIALGQYFSS